MIERSGERGSGISMLTARPDDDDDDTIRLHGQIRIFSQLPGHYLIQLSVSCLQILLH